MPYPALDGGAQVMQYTTRGLLLNGVVVKTLAVNPTRNFVNPDSISEEYKKATALETVKIDTSIKASRILINFFRKESYFTERFSSKEFEVKLQNILNDENFDIIQLEHLYMCKYIDTIRNHSKAIVLLRPQNIEYIIWERFLIGERNLFKRIFLKIATSRLRIYEQKMANAVDGIIPLTREDAEVFSKFTKKPVQIIPMGYDFDKLNGYDFEKQYTTAPVVYHLGSMDWMPNEEAVRWFFEKVMPHLESKKERMQICMAGKKMPEWVYKYKSKNVDVQGEIKNPLKFQEDKLIMIVPLWSGSGIRAKIIEGLALGKTIISTTIGAQGIAYENEKNIIIADDPEQFAAEIVKCVNTPAKCRYIGGNARILGSDQYHFRNTAKKMMEFYKQVSRAND